MRIVAILALGFLGLSCSEGVFEGSNSQASDPEKEEEDTVIEPTIVSGAFLTCGPSEANDGIVYSCAAREEGADASDWDLDAFIDYGEKKNYLEEIDSLNDRWQRSWEVPAELEGKGDFVVLERGSNKTMFEGENRVPKGYEVKDFRIENVTISESCGDKDLCFGGLASFVSHYEEDGGKLKDLVGRGVFLKVSIDSESFSEADSGKVKLEGWNTNSISYISIVDPSRIEIPENGEGLDQLIDQPSGYFLRVPEAGTQMIVKADFTEIRGLRLEGHNADGDEVHGIHVEAKNVKISNTIIQHFYEESGSSGIVLKGKDTSLTLHNSAIHKIDGPGILVGDTGISTCSKTENLSLIITDSLFVDSGLGSFWPNIGTYKDCNKDVTGKIVTKNMKTKSLNSSNVFALPEGVVIEQE